MSETALSIWKSIYPDIDVKNDASFRAIDILINDFSEKKKVEILKSTFITFKSTFVAYRWIYFNFIKDDLPKDEKVKVVKPNDLKTIDVKNDKNFLKQERSTQGGFIAGETPCPYCGSIVYDNRNNKRSPRSPDFRCSANSINECSAHDGRWSKSWWLDSKDLPPEWNESKIVPYDRTEKEKFYKFCKLQIKAVYPKLKDNYTYSHLEKRLLNVVWVNKKDSQLLEQFNKPINQLNRFKRKMSSWRPGIVFDANDQNLHESSSRKKLFNSYGAKLPKNHPNKASSILNFKQHHKISSDGWYEKQHKKRNINLDLSYEGNYIGKTHRDLTLHCIYLYGSLAGVKTIKTI